MNSVLSTLFRTLKSPYVVIRGVFWRSSSKAEPIFVPCAVLMILGNVFLYFFNRTIFLNEVLFFRICSLALDAVLLFCVFFCGNKKNWSYSAWYSSLISSLVLSILLMFKNDCSIVSIFYLGLFVTMLAICIDKILITFTLCCISTLIIAFYDFSLLKIDTESTYRIGAVAVSLLPYWLLIKKSENEKNRYKREWMNNLLNLFANEARTPLRTISSYSMTIANYLPKLIKSYKLADEAGLPVDKVYQVHIDILDDAVTLVNREIHSMFIMIDMALMKLTYNPEEPSNVYSASDSILKAIERYGMSKEAKRLIKLYLEDDFNLQINETSFLHIIFNLLKNSFYYIRAANKGEIIIKLIGAHNTIEFVDTATGIDYEVLPYIFDEFFTTSDSRIGLGLSFCKSTMKKLGGDITCESYKGRYTKFRLIFPKLNEKNK